MGYLWEKRGFGNWEPPHVVKNVQKSRFLVRLLSSKTEPDY